MIYMAEDLPGNGMKTVSFQGVQLSANQRRALDLKRRFRVFTDLALQEQQKLAVERPTTATVRPRSEWTVIRNERGTPCVADAFGF